MMRHYLLSALCAGVLVLSGCATDGSDPGTGGAGTLAGEGAGQEISFDNDGAMVVGVSDQNMEWKGPAELKSDNVIYFGYDSDQIRDQYVAMMQSHAQFLRSNPDSRIIIEGHTDERGTPEYNIALGERRARSVARYMQNLGVDVNQLSIVSYGEEKPIEPGHNEAAWSKNRRAVLNY